MYVREMYVAKHLEGNNRGPMKVLAQYLPGETDENQDSL
jgi:hypothetical protein